MSFDSNPLSATFNKLTLANGDNFIIDYAGYSGYIGPDPGKDITANIDAPDQSGNPPESTAFITLHTGDQQEKTNPGKGKGTDKDGSSYDTDINWKIGWLEPGESATLTIWVAPGVNPAGKYQFSSPGCLYINTGPRVRVYDDENTNGDPYEKKDFQYAIDKTNQLKVCVDTAMPILDEGENEIGVVLFSSNEENCLEMHIWINTDAGYDDTYDIILAHGWYNILGDLTSWDDEYIFPVPGTIVISGGTGEFHESCIPITSNPPDNIHYFGLILANHEEFFSEDWEMVYIS
jgi:hypothetical protein